jgi:molybdopterin-guanine dinucleotide biosynthesis protein A
MGREKGLLEFNGVPLIVHTARLIDPLVSGVTIVGPADHYAAIGFPTIPDQGIEIAEPSRTKLSGGPLRGVAAALASTREPWNLILACDLPYLTAEWLEWLLSRTVHSRAQVVIPRTEHGLEPLAAVYRRECGPSIANAMASGVRKVTDAIGELKLKIILESEWRPLDPRGLVLRNMNTPGDYEEARNFWPAARLGESEHVRKHRSSRERKRRSAPRPSK